MESLAADLKTMVRTPLQPSHVDAMRDVGTEVVYAPGERLQEMGEPITRFHYIL
jgi:thioredoxin reductase (NADPH)